LALRGLFALDGEACKDLVLERGQRIWLTRSLALDVVSVDLPEDVLGLRHQELGQRVLTGVCSLTADPTLRLVTGSSPRADAVLWSTGAGWRVRTDDGSRAVEVGGRIPTSRGPVEVVAVPLAAGGGSPTQVHGRVGTPLTLEVHYDVVQIHRDGHPTATLSGQSAFLIRELAEIDTSVQWASLASQIWPETTDKDALRRRFDVLLSRMRRKLRGAGIRTDRLKPDGMGNFALRRPPSDSLLDRS